jgi:hypothetical protein
MSFISNSESMPKIDLRQLQPSDPWVPLRALARTLCPRVLIEAMLIMACPASMHMISKDNPRNLDDAKVDRSEVREPFWPCATDIDSCVVQPSFYLLNEVHVIVRDEYQK